MKKLYLILALMVGSVCAKAQMIAVNTNLASDALAIPDLGVEMVIGDRSTVGVNVLGGYHPYGKRRYVDPVRRRHLPNHGRIPGFR